MLHLYAWYFAHMGECSYKACLIQALVCNYKPPAPVTIALSPLKTLSVIYENTKYIEYNTHQTNSVVQIILGKLSTKYKIWFFVFCFVILDRVARCFEKCVLAKTQKKISVIIVWYF